MFGSRRQLRAWLGTGLLLLAGALALLIVVNLPDSAPPEPVPPLPPGQDLALSRVRYIESRDGRPSWTLEADSAAHSLLQGEARLERVRMTFHATDDRDELTLTARSGRIDTENGQVDVEGGVELASGAYRLTGRHLAYRDEERLIHSSAPVELIWEGGRLRGQELRFTVDSRRLAVSGGVEGLLRFDGLLGGEG